MHVCMYVQYVCDTFTYLTLIIIYIHCTFFFFLFYIKQSLSRGAKALKEEILIDIQARKY